MPEPREPMVPPELRCACHGWPGSVCDKRAAVARVRFWRFVAWATVAACAGATAALVARGFLRGPSALDTLAATVAAACGGASATLLLLAPRAGGARG